MSSQSLGVALITGSARGIGAAIALRLASDGYDIALADLPSQVSALEDVATQVREKGRTACVVGVDVTEEGEVRAMVEKCVAELGGLDVMVANAGVAKFRTLLTTSVEDWDSMMAVNARGVFLCYKYAAEQMIKQGRGGRIIGACSSAGKRGAPILAAYSASKFAVRGLTQSAALELAPHKITVNCYAPSFVVTDMLAHPDDERLGGRGEWVKSLYSIPKENPLLQPEVVTELVSYLVKPATHILTGECINLNGTVSFD